MSIVVTSEIIFTVFFSILYGIMLNSAMGLGGFAFGWALAGEDIIKRKRKKEDEQSEIEIGWEKGSRSFVRLCFGLVFLNTFPFVYFGVVFHFLKEIIGEMLLTNWVHTVAESLSIGFLSLGVFAFYRLFMFLVVWKPCGNSLIYTKRERDRIMEKRGIHRQWMHQIRAAAFYLIFPWLLVCFFKIIGWLPK